MSTTTSRPNRGGRTLAGVMGVGAAAALISLLAAEEGYEAKPYRDIAGVWTACYGDTYNIDPNKIYTKEECDARLERQALAHVDEVLRCTPGLRDHPKVLIAAGSLTYNIGGPTYCRSSIAANFNRGNFREACNRFGLYNKARVRGVLRPVRGLTNRRARERRICLEGIN